MNDKPKRHAQASIEDLLNGPVPSATQGDRVYGAMCYDQKTGGYLMLMTKAEFETYKRMTRRGTFNACLPLGSHKTPDLKKD